jgi:hypothetical protein
MDPLVPPEVDLRNFHYMPLDVVRLRDSDIAGVEDGEVFRAAVLAWCAAWHQVPAASLPDDDAVLARLTGYGRDLATWKRVREAGALRGFVRCSDGRLYHPVVAEKALEAWEKKGRQAERTRRATEAAAERARVRRESVTDDVTESVTDSKERRGEERKGEERTSPAPVASGGAGGTRAARADRGTRLPEDWSPSDEDRAFAASLGVAVEREAASFRDYWHAKPGADGRKTNWSATWRNWVRRSSERRNGNGSGSRSQSRNGFVVLAERLAREDADRAAGSTVVDFLDPEGRG